MQGFLNALNLARFLRENHGSMLGKTVFIICGPGESHLFYFSFRSDAQHSVSVVKIPYPKGAIYHLASTYRTEANALHELVKFTRAWCIHCIQKEARVHRSHTGRAGFILRGKICSSGSNGLLLGISTVCLLISAVGAVRTLPDDKTAKLKLACEHRWLNFSWSLMKAKFTANCAGQNLTRTWTKPYLGFSVAHVNDEPLQCQPASKTNQSIYTWCAWQNSVVPIG